MITTHTGRGVRYFWGWYTTTSGVTFGCVQTKDNYVEFYIGDNYKIETLHERKRPVYITELDESKEHYEQQANIMLEVLRNGEGLSMLERQALQEWYNWYYKYDSFYIPYP